MGFPNCQSVCFILHQLSKYTAKIYGPSLVFSDVKKLIWQIWFVRLEWELNKEYYTQKVKKRKEKEKESSKSKILPFVDKKSL